MTIQTTTQQHPPKNLPGRSDRSFAEATRKIEHAALAALLPGGLAGWSNNVAEALQALQEAWSRRRASQRSLQRAISSAQPALTHRVTTLSRRAERMSEELDALGAELATLRDALCAERAGALEAMQRESMWRLRDGLVHWSVAARALDAELDAWFAESLYRDHGVAD
jgi:hypothetical protein